MKTKTPFDYDSLFKNALIATIAEAVWLLQSEIQLIEHSWENRNYSISDTSGCIGTITFAQDDLVGAFYNSKGSLSPFNHKNAVLWPYGAALKEVPDKLVQLAKEECLQYLLQEFNGRNQPIFTAVIWSEDKQVFTNNDLNLANENGLYILESFTLDPIKSIEYWCMYYDLKGIELKLVKEIIALKLKTSGSATKLRTETSAAILASSKSTENLNNCKMILKSIDVIF